MRGFSDLLTTSLLQGKTVCVCGHAGAIREALVTLFAAHGATMLLPSGEDGEMDIALEHPQVDSLVFVLPPLRLAALEDTSLADFDETFENGPLHAWRSLHRFLPGMMSRCAGTCVLIGSDTATEGVPRVAAHAMAAGALDALTRAVAMDTARFGIRCNAVLAGMNIAETGETYVRECPGLAAGNFESLQPVHRRGTPQDVAQAALFLASDMSGFMTGESLPVDGGVMAVAHVQDWR